MTRPAMRGFTLLEAMLTITVLAVTASLALPSFGGALARYRLRGAAEALANEMALVRQAATGRDSASYLVARTGADWCLAVATAANADCRAAGASHRVSGSEFPGVTLVESAGQLGDSPLATVSTVRATALFASAQGEQLRVAMTPLGRASICTPNAAVGFSRCAQ